MLETSLHQLSSYYERYRDRLASPSHSFIIHLQTVIKAILALLQTQPLDLSSPAILSTDHFLRRLRIENVNIFELLRFVTSKRILYKLNGFIDKQWKNKQVENGMDVKSRQEERNCNGNASTTSKPTTTTSYFPAVIEFIRALTTDNTSSRIVINYEQSDESYVQLLLLTPSAEFQSIVDSARSVIITGGTLRPVGILFITTLINFKSMIDFFNK